MNKLKLWLSLAASLLLAYFGYTYKRRGEQLEDAQNDAAKQRLATDTAALTERARAAQEAHNDAMEDYRRRRAEHAHMFPDARGPAQPSPRRDD